MTETTDNFDALREHVADARAALAKVPAPTPDADNPLYYPLLFLTETASAVLRHVLRDAYESVRTENEGAATFIRDARAATEPTA